MVFNPILQDLQKNSHTGYKLGDLSYVTLPYADYFCLISTNKATHQKIINKIHSHVSSLGMKLKPSKCTSLSISSGKPKDGSFFIGDYKVSLICDVEQKFLGKLLFLIENLKKLIITSRTF
jgi:hypothetical protein